MVTSFSQEFSPAFRAHIRARTISRPLEEETLGLSAAMNQLLYGFFWEYYI
jgi:hypothetical protein